MKKYCTLLLITSGISFMTSCGEAGNETNNARMGDTTAITTTPAFDLAKAREVIESDNRKFEEDMKRGDSNALAAHYAEDAWFITNNHEPAKGAAIASAWGAGIRSGIKEMKLTTHEITGGAELLAETGTYEAFGEGSKLLDKGTYVVVWKPVNGGWKIYRDIGASNMPPHK